MTEIIEDVEENDVESSYHGNVNLKSIGETHDFTEFQIKEIQRCAEDPIYFIENYCKIVSLDHGLVPFKLYECQKKKVNTILGNRKVIVMEPRQNGKCCLSSTRINIRNPVSREKHTVTIGEFYEWKRFCKWVQDIQSKSI